MAAGTGMTAVRRERIVGLVSKAWRDDVSDNRFGTDAKTAELRIRQFDEAVAEMEKGVAGGRVANARLVDARHTIGSAFSQVVDELVRPILREIGKRPATDAVGRAVDDFFPQFGNLPSAVAKPDRAAVDEPRLRAAIEILDAMLPLHALMQEAKRLSVKKLRGAELAEAKAAAAPPESEAVRAVRRVLVDFTEASADALRQAILSGLRGVLSGYMEKQRAAVEAGREIGQDFLSASFTFDGGRHGTLVRDRDLSLVTGLTEPGRRDAPGGRWARTVRVDAEDRMARMASETARAAQEAFVEKNIRKIGPICDGVNAIPVVSAGRTEVSVSEFTGEVVVAFPDGSGFTASNGIVFNTSGLGTSYVQYPLRFVDVVLPDGTKRRSLPEAAVREAFAPQPGTTPAPGP